MQKKILALIVIMFLGLTVFINETKAQLKPCPDFRGHSYYAFLEGTFDTYPNMASAMLVKFDKMGFGKARKLFAYDPNGTAAEQETRDCSCGVLSDGTKVLYFTYKVKTADVDAGSLTYKIYDNGSRVWVVHDLPGRHVEGWMSMVFPKPAK